MVNESFKIQSREDFGIALDFSEDGRGSRCLSGQLVVRKDRQQSHALKDLIEGSEKKIFFSKIF